MTMERTISDEAKAMRAQGYVPAMEAAGWACRHVSQIYEALEEGRIKGKRIGRARYVEWDSLLAWINRYDTDAAKLLGVPKRLPAHPKGR